MEQKHHFSLETMAALSHHENIAREELESLALVKPSSWDLPVALVQGAAIGGTIYASGAGSLFIALGCGVAFAAFHLANCANASARKLYRQVSALHVIQRASERKNKGGEA